MANEHGYSCHKCRFAEPVFGGRYVECRFNPPTAFAVHPEKSLFVTAPKFYSVFPHMEEDDWCHQFERER